MRPGPIRGSMILCEKPLDECGPNDYTAELSQRGLKKVNCRDCIFIARELTALWGSSWPPLTDE